MLSSITTVESTAKNQSSTLLLASNCSS